MNKKILKKTITLKDLDKKMKWTESEKKEIESKVEYLEMLQELRSLRDSEYATNQEIADRTGISRPQISNIFNGKRNVTIETISRIAAGFGKKIKIQIV